MEEQSSTETVINIRTVTISHPNLGQGDIDDISATLMECGVRVDLSETKVTFVMKHDKNTTRHIIPCSGAEDGTVIIPLTDIETAVPGLFFGQFIVDYRKPIIDIFFGQYYFSDEYFNESFGYTMKEEYVSLPDMYLGDNFFSDNYFSGFMSGKELCDNTAVCTFPSSGYVTIKIERAL